jgi:hypothetical protein
MDMRVHQINKWKKPGSRFLMIVMTFHFLFFVSFTPFAFGMEEEIKVELEMSETLEDAHELTEEFFKEFTSNYNFFKSPLITFEELNEQFFNSYKPDTPFPPPKSL